uniref:Putative LOV domain-containing protein n=1 Tax=Cassytha filiformis TaxID=121073 RepID=A0A126X322_9MAGN|nr:putative LOV domain-containing protein [Cassytha filiformis]
MELMVRSITAEEEIRSGNLGCSDSSCREIFGWKMSVGSGAERFRLVEESLSSRYSSWIRDALDELPDNVLITDPTISGHPIVFASRGFLKTYGYSEEEVLGRNGRIFQGPKADRRFILEVQEAIRLERPMQFTLLNCRKDRTPIRVFFHMIPIFSRDDGRVVHFVATQVPISSNSSGFDTLRSRRNSIEDSSSTREIHLGSCRREVCLNYLTELRRALPYDSPVHLMNNRELEAEESREVSDLEKQNAAESIHSVLSTLIRYSELTGKLVCGERGSSIGIYPLNSSLTISLGRIRQSFVLTDPHLHDMPIIFASDAFLVLTGYSRDEVLGRNCRFLQGADTNIEALCEVREAIQAAQSCTVRIFNYRKDGSSFWNLLHISPVRNASGKIAFYVGVQFEEGSESCFKGLSPEMILLGAVGAVKVAVRSLSVGVAPSKPLQ